MAPPITRIRFIATTPLSVFKDAPDRAHPVLPGDLLPLGVRAARVTDPHLVDPAAHPRHLGGHLRLEAEPVLLDSDLPDDLAAKGLVACLHVGQVDVGEHVRQGGEELVPHRVPVDEDSLRSPPANREP